MSEEEKQEPKTIKVDFVVLRSLVKAVLQRGHWSACSYAHTGGKYVCDCGLNAARKLDEMIRESKDF
jgi:hypothetical protein